MRSDVFAAERERVFLPSWQLVADTDRARMPWQEHPFTLLDGCLAEPLLFLSMPEFEGAADFPSPARRPAARPGGLGRAALTRLQACTTSTA